MILRKRTISCAIIHRRIITSSHRRSRGYDAKTEHLVSKKAIDDTKKHTICCPIIYHRIITSSHRRFRWYDAKNKHSVSKKK